MLPEIEFITPILNVSSVPESMAWFEKIGWKRTFTWNSGGVIEDMATSDDNGVADFAGVGSGRVQIFLCLDDQGSRASNSLTSGETETDNNRGNWISVWVSTPRDLGELYQAAVQHGMEIILPLTDQPWGSREFRLKHPDGHILRINVVL